MGIRAHACVGLILAGVAASGCSALTSLDGLAGGTSGSEIVGDGGAGNDGRAPTTLSDASSPSGHDGAGGGGGLDAGSSSSDAGAGGDTGASDPGDAATSDPCAACPGACGTTISAPMSSTPTGWVLNGTAQYDGASSSAALTSAGGKYQAGSIVYAHAIAFTDVVVQFQFRIGSGGGTRSDGMGFMLETTAPNVVGNSGGGLGLSGLTGFGVELDVHDNGSCGDSNGDHVGVDSLAFCDPSNQAPTSIATADLSGTLDLADAQWHTAQVLVTQGLASVVVDGNAALSAVPLPGFSPSTPYYFGFAGANGGLVLSDGTGGMRFEVKGVLISFPTKRCL